MIIIMGPVGSGKSEQTNRLAQRLNLDKLSTSQLLHDNLTPARQAAMAAGDLVDDDEVINLISPELSKQKASNKDFILDGFPRTIAQARWLVDQIKAGRVKYKAVIKLNVSDATVLKRLLARGRSDDQEDIIRHRLEVYRQLTDPIIKYLQDNALVVNEINGEQSPDRIEKEIQGIIGR